MVMVDWKLNHRNPGNWEFCGYYSVLRLPVWSKRSSWRLWVGSGELTGSPQFLHPFQAIWTSNRAGRCPNLWQAFLRAQRDFLRSVWSFGTTRRSFISRIWFSTIEAILVFFFRGGSIKGLSNSLIFCPNLWQGFWDFPETVCGLVFGFGTAKRSFIARIWFSTIESFFVFLFACFPFRNHGSCTEISGPARFGSIPP